MARSWSRHRPRACALTVVVLTVAVSAALFSAVGVQLAGAAVTSGSGKRTDAGGTAGWITSEANRLSGRTLNVVCAATDREWAASVAMAGFPAADADGYYGLSLIDEGEMHLSPYVCEGLRLGLSPAARRANDLQVAWAVDVLVHESTHLGRRTLDESLTEACARDGLPGALYRLYGIGAASPELARLLTAATWFRRTQPAAYQGGRCELAPRG